MLKKRRFYLFIASIVAHILLFLLFVLLQAWGRLAHIFERNLPDNEPLVVELLHRGEVVETPDDAKIEKRDKDTDLLSDKDAVARNEQDARDIDVADAYAEGDFDVNELRQETGPKGEEGIIADAVYESTEMEKIQKELEEELADDDTDFTRSKFRRESLIKPRTTRLSGTSQRLPRPNYDNLNSRALEQGGLSFNTYAWDFAPYMIALKKKVERNIYPPAAYFRMGLIEGQTLLSFRIYPDGEMKNLRLINFEGHQTLMETSMHAIEASIPFMPLPDDFPEPYLEITAKFAYRIQKSRR